MFHLDDFDCELDDDFFEDAFNVTSKGAIEKSLDPELQHCTELKDSLPKAADPESDGKCSKISLCPDVSTPTELGSTLQHNYDLIQLSRGPNNAQHVPNNNDKGFLGKKIDFENLTKDVKPFGQKKPSFMSYDEKNLNSTFSFDSDKDLAGKNTTSEKRMPTQCASELHAQKGKKPISRNLSSFPAVRCATSKSRTMSGTSHCNDNNRWANQPNSASFMVPVTPVENIVNQELRDYAEVQPRNSSDCVMVSRLRRGKSLKQDIPAFLAARKRYLCPDVSTPRELGSTLQHNPDLIQLSRGPNNAQHVPKNNNNNNDKGFGGEKIDFENLMKDVKPFGQKKLSFMSYNEKNLNSTFSFDSDNDPAGKNTTSEKRMPTQCASELHAQKGKKPISRNLSSFPAVRCATSKSRTMPGTSHCNDNNRWANQPNSASFMVPVTPLENIVNQELRDYAEVQPRNNSDCDMVSRLSRGKSLKQDIPAFLAARKRKFPGPAGILPETPPGSYLYALSKQEGSSVAVSENVLPQDFPCSQSLSDEFEKCAWKTMLKDFTCEASNTSIPDILNIALVLRQAAYRQLPERKVPLLLPNGKAPLLFRKVPLLCVLLKNMFCKGSNLVTFADKTGEMKALIHDSVLAKYEFIQPGAVLVLQQVSVFSPSPESHYMIVTLCNIASLYDVQGRKISAVSSSSQLLTMAKRLIQEVCRIQQGLYSGNTRRISSNSFERKEKMPYPHPRTKNSSGVVQMKDICVIPANSATGISDQTSDSGYGDSKATAGPSHHNNQQTVAGETAFTESNHGNCTDFEDELDYLISSVDEKLFYPAMKDDAT